MTIQAPPPPTPVAPTPVAPAPPADLLRCGQRIPVAWGYSTVLPSWDVETYSEAGFIWDEVSQKFKPPIGATKKGLPAVGSSVYFEHPTADIICMAYDLKDGRGRRRWKPGQPNPRDLIDYLLTYDDSTAPSYSQPGLITAHNSGFEIRCAIHVLHKKYNWPLLNIRQMRCSMAKARAFSLPGALGNLSAVLKTAPKNPNGDKLIRLFSCPQNPTSKRPAGRVSAESEPQKALDYEQYNEDDIIAEAAASARIPDLMPQELEYWLADQACNWRGVGVDVESVAGCIQVLQQAHAKYNAELYQITGGEVARASEATALGNWVFARSGVRMKSKGKDSIDAEAIAAALANPKIPQHPAGGLVPVRRVLEIRDLIGSAAVKKVYSMARMATRDNRACDMHVYHGARTGRDTHQDLQTGNLAKSGPQIRWCTDVGCNRPYAHSNHACPWCGADSAFSDERDEGRWSADAVDDALALMRVGNLELVEYFFGDAVLTISGCVRGLLVAAPGHKLLCSDYSSIEAVVAAMLSGESWRQKAFEERKDIYLMGAAAITGKTYEWYFENGGKKHPDRQKIGKVSELALGFQGGPGSWKNFDKSGTFSDQEIKELVQKWRAASPAIVEAWGGQIRGKPWRPDKYENYGIEGMMVNAVQNPGQVFTFRLLSFQVVDDILFITLPSGRRLTYHSPQLVYGAPRDQGRRLREGWAPVQKISYMTWNSNPGMGPLGWTRMDTYGGRAFENCVQGIARDVMAHAVVRLEAAGYPVVMRIHDEIVCEVLEPTEDHKTYIGAFEAVMADLPEWAKGWPIRAAGGWLENRYRKD